MSLQLDSRQRAMLQEMGITVWLPAPPKTGVAPVRATRAAATAPPAATSPAATTAAAPAEPAATAPAMPAPPAATAPVIQTAAAPVVAPASRAAAALRSAPTRAAGQVPALRLHAPVLLYPQPEGTPAQLDSGWLVVVEGRDAARPFAGDAGKLLDNMLRALGLHQHPRCYAAVLTRDDLGAPATPAEEQGALSGAFTLEQITGELRPAMVLALGLSAARHVLASGEPLGRLRAQPHKLADGTPVVVSHDPAYLLRTPQAKAATWADLCRALALLRPPT